MKTRSKINKVNIVTLGCSKNLVDSEVLLTQLKANQLNASHQNTANDSNIIIVNTCGFIDRAKEESIQTILQYAKEKEEGRIEKLYVTGCLSHRYKDDLRLEIPEVDAWFGTMELPGLLHTLGADYKHELLGERINTAASHYAYLKISEGCNRTCSFCAIPIMRGKHISRPWEELVKETKHLASTGVKEIMLIAQELTYYGLDIYQKRTLPDLLHRLSEVEGIEWIRLHYAYPHKFPLEIADVMKENPKICRYLDMPLQHASDAVLKRMKRQITQAETQDLIDTIREKVPGLTLRTTLLLGFPGETEEDMDIVAEFIERNRFNRLGCFSYSHEEGTSAFALTDNVPEEVKQERVARIMEIQSDISRELNQQKVGSTVKTLFDRIESGFFVGRTEADSPEVDNEVLVETASNYLRIGDFANILVTSADEFDLYGKVTGE